MKPQYKNVLAGIGASAILLVSVFILITSFGLNNDGGLSALSISSTDASKSAPTDTSPQQLAGSPSADFEHACGFIRQWSGFNTHLDVSADAYSTANIFVISGNEIQVFSSSEKYLYTLPNKDTKTTFNNPSAVAGDIYGNIYVADTGNNLIKKLTAPTLVTDYVFEKSWPVSKPTDVAYSNDTKSLYVLSDSKTILKALTSDKAFVTFTNYSNMGTLQHIAVSPFNFQYPTRLYATDSTNNKVIKFDVNASVGNNFVKEWGKFGVAEGYFNGPSGIGADGLHVVVADTGNNRVQVFTVDGDFITQIQGVFNSKERFINPIDIAFNNGSYYVADNKGSFIHFGIDCGNIVVKKEVKPTINSTNFNFHIFDDRTNPVSFSSDFILNDDGENFLKKPTNQNTFGVAPGGYTIEENFNDPTYQTSLKCTSNVPGGFSSNSLFTKSIKVLVKGSETITCTFTNSKLPVRDPTKDKKWIP